MHNACRSEHANFIWVAQGWISDFTLRLRLRVALGCCGFRRCRDCRQNRLRHRCGRASAGGAIAGRLAACSGVQGSEPECETSNLKKPQGAVLISLRKDSMDTGMGCIGSCAPRCCGVRGRSPARTAARSCCCALSAPRTSSRLYNSRELPRWWPWASLSGPRMLGTSSI